MFHLMLITYSPTLLYTATKLAVFQFSFSLTELGPCHDLEDNIGATLD